jgi:hypothetical protein
MNLAKKGRDDMRKWVLKVLRKIGNNLSGVLVVPPSETELLERVDRLEKKADKVIRYSLQVEQERDDLRMALNKAYEVSSKYVADAEKGYTLWDIIAQEIEKESR